MPVPGTLTQPALWSYTVRNLAHLAFLPVEKVGKRCPVTLRQREKDLNYRTGLLAAGLNIPL